MKVYDGIVDGLAHSPTVDAGKVREECALIVEGILADARNRGVIFTEEAASYLQAAADAIRRPQFRVTPGLESPNPFD